MLKKYTAGVAVPKIDELKRIAYIEARNEVGGHRPDYVYKNNRKISLDTCNTTGELLIKSLKELAKQYLQFRDKKIFIINERFSKWQETLCRTTPLPLITSAIKNNNNFSDYSPEEVKETLKENLRKTALPYPYLPLLEKLKNDNGVYELHIHLNGSTEMDVMWQEMLKKPMDFYNCIREGENKEIVREQYLQVDEDIDENILFQYLHLARKLRVLLVGAIENDDKKVDINSEKLKRLMNVFDYNDVVDIHPRINWLEHPVESLPGEFFERGTSILEQESYFIIKSLEIVEECEINAQCLHVYLLIQNLVNKFMVQQVNQFGFDQFQKITLNEHRELLEKKNYTKRFRQFEGMHGQTLDFIEGRFAPKKEALKVIELLHKITEDYKKYFKNATPSNEDTEETESFRKMILGLVGHFIKMHESVKHDSSPILHICRYYYNRKKYRREAEILAYLYKTIPFIKDYLNGFDAASNELHTPPEVFAPIYRYLKRRGFTNFTFHCGEDYVHLLSGIRSVYESVKFLELEPQNRIGHGTAVGICPELWIERAGEKIAIAQGEWLDNLICSYYILMQSPDFQHEANRISHEMSTYFNKIYNNSDSDPIPFNTSLLVEAWLLRYLDPVIACDEYKLNNKLKEIFLFEHIEWDIINEKKKENLQAFNLFKKYHSHKIILEYNEIIEVRSDYLSAEVMYYLQEEVLKLINSKSIAIESLPTSNVRISYYHNHYEHHIYRWLTGKWKDRQGERPIVVLGSDDPGIFGTSVQNEYAHVYELLKEKGMPERQVYQMLKEMNDHSRAYAFCPEGS